MVQHPNAYASLKIKRTCNLKGGQALKIPLIYKTYQPHSAGRANTHMIMKSPLILFLFLSLNYAFSQNTDFPNITEDLVNEKSYYHDWGLDMTIYGYTGICYQGHYVKKNSIYGSLTAGLGFYNNFRGSEFEGEQSGVLAYAGTLELGYSFELLVRSNEDRFIADQFVSSDRDGNYSRNTSYYTIDQPEHVFLIPLAGINYLPGTFNIQTINANSKLNTDGRFNQSVLVLNTGLKLMRIINNKVAIKAKGKKELITGSSFKYSDIYLGMNFPLISSYETSPSYANINAAAGPTIEAYIGWPTRYSNASGYFKFGYKSIPYVRKGMLRPIDGDSEINTSGFGQLYMAFRFYL